MFYICVEFLNYKSYRKFSFQEPLPILVSPLLGRTTSLLDISLPMILVFQEFVFIRVLMILRATLIVSIIYYFYITLSSLDSDELRKRKSVPRVEGRESNNIAMRTERLMLVKGRFLPGSAHIIATNFSRLWYAIYGSPTCRLRSSEFKHSVEKSTTLHVCTDKTFPFHMQDHPMGNG